MFKHYSAYELFWSAISTLVILYFGTRVYGLAIGIFAAVLALALAHFLLPFLKRLLPNAK